VKIGLFHRGFDVSFREGFVVSFVFGFLVRLVPEVLSFPYPIGFDTVYYAARMKSGVVWYHWSQVFSTWLIYGILVPVYNAVRGDPFLLLKVVAPLLYGLNVCGVYFFARKALNWETKKALIAGFFFAFQLASLGISWEFYRNMLGLAMLLFALPLIGDLKTKMGFGLFVLLSLFVVFGHEYASVTLFAVVLGLVVGRWLKRRMASWRVLAAVVPALAVFLASVYFIVFPVSFHVTTNVIMVHDTFQHSPGGLFFLVDYLSVANSIESYPTYLRLVSHVFSLFALLYLVWLPLVLVGFFRDKILDGWTILLLIGSFGCLVVPFCALDSWHRWMLMLVYPFTFYAVNGAGKVLGSQRSVAPGVSWLKWMKVSRRMTFGLLSCIGLLGSLFMTVRFGNGGGVFYIPATVTYFPTTMLHNTVPLQDTKATVEAMEWLDGRMDNGSCVLLFDAFLSWADLHLDKKNVIVHYEMDAGGALNLALGHGFNPIYLIWWNQNIGWYGSLSVPERFAPVFNVERISVFRYY
jgi:hypothetical protein